MRKVRGDWKSRPGLVSYYGIYFSFFLIESAALVARPLLFKRLGFGFADIGSLIGLSYAAVMVVRFLASSHSDSVGRKFYVVSALALSGIAKVGYSTGILPLFPLFVFFDGAARGMFIAMQEPILRSFSTPTNRGRMLGVRNSLFSLSGTIGGPLGGVLFVLVTPPLLIFRIYGAILFVATFLVARFVSIPRGRTTLADTSFFRVGRKQPFASMIKGASSMLFLICIVNMLQVFVIVPLSTAVIPLYITEVLAYSAAAVGVVLGLDAFFSTGTSLVGGFLADKFYPRTAFSAFSFLIASLALLIALWGGNAPVFFVLSVLLGAIFTGVQPFLEKFGSFFVREHRSGFDYGLIGIAMGVGASLGSWVGGHVMEIWGGAGFFFMMAIVYGVIGVVLFSVRGRELETVKL